MYVYSIYIYIYILMHVCMYVSRTWGRQYLELLKSLQALQSAYQSRRRPPNGLTKALSDAPAGTRPQRPLWAAGQASGEAKNDQGQAEPTRTA